MNARRAERLWAMSVPERRAAMLGTDEPVRIDAVVLVQGTGLQPAVTHKVPQAGSCVSQHFLTLAGYEVYIPRIREQRVRRYRRVGVILPLFPAYAFVVIEQQMAHGVLDHRRGDTDH